MKKQLLLWMMAVAGLFVISCQSQEVSPSDADGALEAVQVSAARNAATTDTVTKQKCKGQLTAVDSTALPAAIITYLNTNYAGALVKFAGTDPSGQYVVGIVLNNVHTGLLFDASGNFVQLLKQYAKKAKLTPVDAASLPAAITTYISSNFSGYTVKRAGTDADGNYYVAITNTTEIRVLVFAADGTFTKEADIPPMNGGRGGKGPKPRKKQGN